MSFEPLHLAMAVMFLLVWIIVGEIAIAGRRSR
jgi:hypothetical protein